MMKRLAMTVAALALALAATAAGKDRIQFKGKITAIDRTAKKITVKTKEGEKTALYRTPGHYYAVEKIEQGDVKTGEQVVMYGKVDEAKKSIEARNVTTLSVKHGERIRENQVIGTVKEAGDGLVVTVKGQECEVKVTKKTAFNRRIKLLPEDLEVGDTINGQMIQQGNQLLMNGGQVIQSFKAK